MNRYPAFALCLILSACAGNQAIRPPQSTASFQQIEQPLPRSIAPDLDIELPPADESMRLRFACGNDEDGIYHCAGIDPASGQHLLLLFIRVLSPEEVKAMMLRNHFVDVAAVSFGYTPMVCGRKENESNRTVCLMIVR